MPDRNDMSEDDQSPNDLQAFSGIRIEIKIAWLACSLFLTFVGCEVVR
jgi:hypothetical protein